MSRLYSVNYGYYADKLHNKEEEQLFHILILKVVICHVTSCELRLLIEYAHKVEQQMRIENNKALVHSTKLFYSNWYPPFS